MTLSGWDTLTQLWWMWRRERNGKCTLNHQTKSVSRSITYWGDTSEFFSLKKFLRVFFFHTLLFMLYYLINKTWNKSIDNDLMICAHWWVLNELMVFWNEKEINKFKIESDLLTRRYFLIYSRVVPFLFVKF